MVDVKSKKCDHDGCNKRPVYNFPTETTGLYCFEHKLANMVDVTHKRCDHDGCNKRPTFNSPTETTGLYCFEHKLANMMNVKNKRCQHSKCKQDALYGLVNKRAQFCVDHKQSNMINMILENKCYILECDNEYEFTVYGEKYCLKHHPDPMVETQLKRLCMYCDIKEHSVLICKECKKIMNKKEWGIVRHLRKTIDTKFEYNSSKMLQGCSKKRPDVYFELQTHCVIVEIDEHQHKTYGDICECARINEIVSGIGGKSVIIIRFNPDTTKHKSNSLKLELADKIDLLVKVVKDELIKNYDNFIVKIIQIYYDDDCEEYKEVKEETITKLVCV
jgi:hypothetical protein